MVGLSSAVKIKQMAVGKLKNKVVSIETGHNVLFPRTNQQARLFLFLHSTFWVLTLVGHHTHHPLSVGVGL